MIKKPLYGLLLIAVMAGAALESVVGLAKISLSETKKEIHLQNGSDFIYQVYSY